MSIIVPVGQNVKGIMTEIGKISQGPANGRIIGSGVLILPFLLL
jgi:hypothetical protein